MPFDEYKDLTPTDIKVFMRKLDSDEPLIFGKVVNAPELDLMSAIRLADEINRNGYPSLDGTFKFEAEIDWLKSRWDLFKTFGLDKEPRKRKLKWLKALGLAKRPKLTYKTIKKR